MPFTMTVRPPLTLPLTMPCTMRALLERIFEFVPGSEALGLVARQARFAVTVFQRFDRDADEIAGLDFDFAAIVHGILQPEYSFPI